MPQLDRGSIGIGLAALSGTAAGISLAAGCPLLTGVFAGLAVLILLIAFAPALPLINRVPIIGGHYPQVLFSGDPGLVLHAKPGETVSVVVHAGFRNDARRDIERVRINFLVPDSVTLARCDSKGNDLNRGSLEHTAESLTDGPGSNYWNETDITLYGRGSTLLHFRLGLPGPDRYPIRLKIDSPSFYSAFVRDNEVRVEPDGEDAAEAPELPAEKESEVRPEEVVATTAEKPDDPQARLVNGLNAELRRGRRIKDRIGIGGVIGIPGQGPATEEEVYSWESDVAYMLDQAGRQDLTARFLYDPPQGLFGFFTRTTPLVPVGLRDRMKRRLAALNRINRELQGNPESS